MTEIRSPRVTAWKIATGNAIPGSNKVPFSTGRKLESPTGRARETTVVSGFSTMFGLNVSKK